MKRFLTGLAVTLMTTGVMATPASANAAPPAYVKAFKAQMVPGKGMKVAESSSIILDFTSGGDAMQVKVTARDVGTVAFGKGTIAAADFRSTMTTRGRDPEPSYRVITRGRDAWITNPGIAKALPGTLAWVRSRSDAGGNTVLNVGVTAKELEFMLANSSETSTGQFEGTATLADFGDDPKAGEGSVEFQLYFGKNNLLTRSVIHKITYPDGDSSSYDQMAFHTDTTYSAWGSKVTITAPPAKTIVNENKLGKYRKAVLAAGYPEHGPF